MSLSFYKSILRMVLGLNNFDMIRQVPNICLVSLQYMYIFYSFFLGETIPLRLKRDTKKYVSPIENFIILTNKYRVQLETIQNATDPKNGTETASNIAVQNLQDSNTQTDDVTTTQGTTSLI